METTPDFGVFKEILLGNGVSLKESSTAGKECKLDESGCPEHPSYAAPSLTLQNYGCKSCAKLRKYHPVQPSNDKPFLEQTSHDNPFLEQTSPIKPLLEQALQNKLLLEQLKQSSDKTSIGVQRGFSHPEKVDRGRQHASSQRSGKLQGKVCPEHPCYALPSLTLQNNGCKSCAMMNSTEPQFGQMKEFSRPSKDRTYSQKTEHNLHGSNHSQTRMSRGKYYQGQRPRLQDDTRQLLKILDLSRNFYKQTSLGSDINNFEGAGVNPYSEDSAVFEKYVDDIDSSAGSRHHVKRSVNSRGGGDSYWKPFSGKCDSRREFLYQ